MLAVAVLALLLVLPAQGRPQATDSQQSELGLNTNSNCTDNPFFADCQRIVQEQYCTHKFYARFCCKSCTQAGQLSSEGPPLDRPAAYKKWVLAAESNDCLGNLEVYGADYKIPVAGRCRNGYARHSNGRCYRVVNELPEGGVLPKHAFQVASTTLDCYLDSIIAGYDEEMESQGRLDVCDEDGGCEPYGSDHAVPTTTCQAGYLRDIYGYCQRSLALIRNATKRPPKPSKN